MPNPCDVIHVNFTTKSYWVEKSNKHEELNNVNEKSDSPYPKIPDWFKRASGAPCMAINGSDSEAGIPEPSEDIPF